MDQAHFKAESKKEEKKKKFRIGPRGEGSLASHDNSSRRGTSRSLDWWASELETLEKDNKTTQETGLERQSTTHAGE